MIRLLTQADHEHVMALVSDKPAENLFIIGDIEAFGYDAEIQQLWGQFEEDTLIAILLRYDRNFIPYSKRDFYDVDGFADIILQHDGDFELSGLLEVVAPLKEKFQFKTYRDSTLYYAKCEKLAYDTKQRDYSNVTTLQPHEYEENIDMLKSIPEFVHGAFSIEVRKREAKNNTGRTYILRNDEDVMVASASTTAENSQSAMIVSVGTNPPYKRKGYATICMEKLCSDMFKTGRTLCLFYDNPEAGRIYKRLGFEDSGYWSMTRYNSG